MNAGCPEQVCKKCGKPREKIENVVAREPGNWGTRDREDGKYKNAGLHSETGLSGLVDIKEVVGYTDCGCNAGFEGGVILDPFMGSGTVAKVAKYHKRRFIGIDLNPEYIGIAKKRLEQEVL